MDLDDLRRILTDAAELLGSGFCSTEAAAVPAGDVRTSDVNCDNAVTALDGLHVLLFIAGLPELPKPGTCPAVGSPI